MGNKMPGNGFPRFIAGILHLRIETVQSLGVNGYPETSVIGRFDTLDEIAYISVVGRFAEKTGNLVRGFLMPGFQ